MNFGNFIECINFNRIISSFEIHGQHCMITYSSILSHDFDEISFEYDYNDSENIIERETVVRKTGICLPAICSHQQVVNFTKEILRESNYVILNTFCQRKQLYTLQPFDYFVV